MNATISQTSTKTRANSRRIFDVDKNLGVILITPSVILLATLVIYPLFYAGQMSLSDVTLVKTGIAMKFIGLENYRKIFADQVFLMALRQSLIYSALQVSGTLLVGLAIALMVHHKEDGGLLIRVLRYVFLLPWALSYVVNAVLWGWLFNGSFGLVNYLLKSLGIIKEYHVWFADANLALIAVIIANIWKAAPFIVLMLLAALKNVPKEHTEAARVDGANGWNCFLHITLPEIMPTIVVLTILETMWSFKSFDLIWVLTQGGPANRTTLIGVYSYMQSFKFFNFGVGTASAMVMTLMILVLVIFYQKKIRVQ